MCITTTIPRLQRFLFFYTNFKCKGDFINRGCKKVLNLKYTPDFLGVDFIIETKGRANDSFPLRWKLFKEWMMDNNDNRTLYKPQCNRECDVTIELILKNRNK